jgi:hypothetical protein
MFLLLLKSIEDIAHLSSIEIDIVIVLLYGLFVPLFALSLLLGYQINPK